MFSQVQIDENRKEFTVEKWNIKIYNRYVQPFFPWLITEFGSPWWFVIFLSISLIETAFGKKFYVGFTLTFLGFILLSLLIGLYQRSLDVLLFSPGVIYVAKDGVYGKSFLGRLFLPSSRPRLLAKWEDIERVELKKYPFNLSKNTGYVEFIKKDGKKFHISYHGFAPVSKGFYDAEWKILCNETDRTICTELFGIIAWKIGIDKFKGFDNEEKKALNGVRKNTLSIEGFRRVIDSIEYGKAGGAREDLPYKKMDEEWEKEEKESSQNG